MFALSGGRNEFHISCLWSSSLSSECTSSYTDWWTISDWKKKDVNKIITFKFYLSYFIDNKIFENVYTIKTDLKLTWWKPRYPSILCVAKKTSPSQVRIIRNPFRAWNKEKILGVRRSQNTQYFYLFIIFLKSNWFFNRKYFYLIKIISNLNYFRKLFLLLLWHLVQYCSTNDFNLKNVLITHPFCWNFKLQE